jgi:hypothetical protein
MTFTLEIGPHLMLVVVVGILALLAMEWWSYASGWRRGR